MGLRPQIPDSNMYGFITHTWNVIKGKCEYSCIYCYMNRFPLRDIHFDETELKTDLGEGNVIFVGSSCDMWAGNMDYTFISRTLEHCERYPNNKYHFQSKNPYHYFDYGGQFPRNWSFFTTIESDYIPAGMSRAPSVSSRAENLRRFQSNETGVNIEPIMKFNEDSLVRLIDCASPNIISIGADSKGVLEKLDLEPTSDEIISLVRRLREEHPAREIRLKRNLIRLLGDSCHALDM